MDRPLRLLVASDKFKGSMSGAEACQAIADGVIETLGFDRVNVRILPIADGGEGMAKGITEAKEGHWVEAIASDPLGRPVTAGYGVIDGGETAVIEMAEASGLWRVAEPERDPWRSSTGGTGELMRHAMEGGARRILLGIGGSSTNDGGVGMAEALGFRFLDGSGDPVDDLPASLTTVSAIDSSHVPALPPVTVACDVTNPLLGPHGCTRVYGPQKGVRPEEFERHEARLQHLVELLGETGAVSATMAGSGAAGGLGFGCLVFLGAALKPGFSLVAEVLGLEAAIAEADLVITGEGRLDEQTLQGKAPAGVAELARKLGKPVAAFAGVVEEEARPALGKSFDFFAPIDAEGLSLAESMNRGAELLRATAARHASTLAGLVE
ncbi:MAG: glycerate kinase [Verrucomicrobiae bacterium]|nr:glycerate kinase [Verrucomicrobiae bacterium]